LDYLKRYADDINGVEYEIRLIGKESYLVFVMSVVKVALAMDESKMFDKVSVALELRKDSFDSFSSSDNFVWSLIATLIILGVFLIILFFLSVGVKETIFGIISKRHKPKLKA
jgi:hypothetical protein